MSEPTTEAGRSLAAWTFGVAWVANPDVALELRRDAEKQIAAIEAEARAAVLAELRTAVENAGHHIDCAEGCDCGFDVALSLIDRLAKLEALA